MLREVKHQNTHTHIFSQYLAYIHWISHEFFKKAFQNALPFGKEKFCWIKCPLHRLENLCCAFQQTKCTYFEGITYLTYSH